MPADVPLQLFPAPASKTTKPGRKGSRRKATQPAPQSQPTAVAESTKSPTSLEEIVIHVTEERSIPAQAQASASWKDGGGSGGYGEGTSRSTTPAGTALSTIATTTVDPRAVSPALTNHPAETVAQKSMLSKSRAASPALTNGTSNVSGQGLRPGPPKSRATSPAPTNALSTVSGSATLVRSNSDASRTVHPTSAGPIRSIFPRYNPALPLQHQIYRPTQASPSHVAPEHISKEAYSPSLYSAGSPGQRSPGQGVNRGVGCFSAPSTVTSFPVGIMGEQHRPRFSSVEELVDLWEAANGQVTTETGKLFALKMIRSVLLLRRCHCFTLSLIEF